MASKILEGIKGPLTRKDGSALDDAPVAALYFSAHCMSLADLC